MHVGGVRITVERNVLYAFGILAAVVAALVSGIAWVRGDLAAGSLGAVVGIALATASFYFFAQCVHLIGHALAAWATGYPMHTMLFTSVFAMSLYPPDEPHLPDQVHMQRSLGGVVAFGLLLGVVFMFWLAMRTAQTWPLRYLATAMLIVVGLLFAVSAILTDGVLFIARKAWRGEETTHTTRV